MKKTAKKSLPKKRPVPAKVRRGLPVDREAILHASSRLDHDTLLDFLGELMARVPDAALRDLVEEYVDVATPTAATSLLAEVRRFAVASHAGEFYEAFRVNSRNFAELSSGTEHWIEKMEQIYRRIIAEIPVLPPAETREMLALLSGLMHDVDGDNDIVFWADEGGSWRIDIDWKDLLGHWLPALGATTSPIEYARTVTAEAGRFFGKEREQYLRLAKKHATPEQRKALATLLQ